MTVIMKYRQKRIKDPIGPKDPMGWIIRVSLPLPSLQDNTADVDRLRQALRQKLDLSLVDLDLALVRQVPAILQANGYEVDCVVAQDRDRAMVLDLHPISHPDEALGLAVDLGTTRVVLRLVDLVQGRVLAETAFDNPQSVYGPDILARIHHADTPEGAAQLQHAVVEGINHHVQNLCRSQGLPCHNLYLLCVAGNTAMSHLFLGLPVQAMIREPYIPTMNRFGLIRASDLGLNAHRAARVMVFPCAGSYLGGDIVAGILFCGLNQHKAPSLLVDVGTNAEVVLGNCEWMMACAGAAGPALEGGVSRIGSTAKPGVIDRVGIDPDTRQLTPHTIEELPPSGICGSGFIDLAAGLFGAGMIDIRGKFRWENCVGREVEKNGRQHFIVTGAHESANGQDLCISQADMDSLIRSKAAMFTILETITTAMGMEMSAIDTFYVAGTFGSFINPRSAITIGMLPDLPLTKFQSLGNSSLGGATMALQSRAQSQAVDRIRDSITYLELNVNQEFMNRFSAAKFLPHTDPTRFPSVPIPKN